MPQVLKNLALIDQANIHSNRDFLLDENGLTPLVEGQKIEGFEVIDCSGLFVSKAWIDLRCSSGDPGFEHKEDIDSLCETLLKSGFGTGVLLPNTNPVIQSKNEIDYVKAKSAKHAVKLLIQAAVTIGTKGEDLTEILDMHYQTGVKIFGDGLVTLANSDRYMKILQYLQKFDGVLFDHAYDPLLSIFGKMHEGKISTNLGLKGIPNLAEDVAIQKNLEILRYTGGKVHFQTLSTRKGVDLIRKAKAEGLKVTSDISIYQLIFKDSDLVTFDPNYKVIPPFRREEDRQALIEGLKDGTIDALVSNHQPQDYDSKFMEFDLAENGMAGLMTFLPAMVSLEKELTWPLLIDKVTSGPAKVIEDSEKDSWVIFDPKEKWTFNRQMSPSKASNSPWFGKELQGKAKYFIKAGALTKLT
ncbi:dihydroorotase [Algoriphagus sediminis]|uniref:Dihydroorotase n=1 Tax=Algoriphagus sediminis TaxID=3057113 RepID=A0ABT7YAB1_9BACT|nr:dihydroorotase [Algoriphagus sediminis]MDN3203144.1 dihydroorotase [Algoriphagus sediminis]